MTICLAFVLSLLLPFSYLLVKLCVYLLNKYNIFKGTNIIFQYVLCMFLSCITTLNFNFKNINIEQYYRDIMSNIKIEGWFVDYFGMEVLTCLIYFRLIDLRTKNIARGQYIYFKTSIIKLFSIDNVAMNYIVNIIYVGIMMHYAPVVLILETLYYLYLIQCENNNKYIYTNNIKHFYIIVYLFTLILEFTSWIKLVIEWDTHLCLSGFMDTSTDTSFYITISMIYIYFFQISLFSEILNNNRYLMIFLIILSFSNATLATCIYMIYFELYIAKMVNE